MNNPLAQRAQYYLNESDRLSEELNTEIEYSAVLEAVLEELVGTEIFLKIVERYIPAEGVSSTHRVVNGKRVERTDAGKERYGHRLGQIRDIHDRATSDRRNSSNAFAQANREVRQTDQHQFDHDKARALQARAHAALTLHGGNTGDDPNKHPSMMSFASGGATPEQRASVGVARPAVAARPAAYGNDARPAIAAVDAQTNDVTGAIADHQRLAAKTNVSTGAAAAAMASNAAGRGESISVSRRGKGGAPRELVTGTRRPRQGLLFPVNASYEPNLVQGIMNLLMNQKTKRTNI